MLNLLNDNFFDNERNVLNADLFVGNLKNTLEGFKFNTKITYEVYRMVTVYHISWNDDKTVEDICNLKKEIGLALGISGSEVDIEKVQDNEVMIKASNMKTGALSLKELLVEFKKDNGFKLPLGLDEYDKVALLDLDKEKGLLVGGSTGIGKTNLFHSMILSTLINYPEVDIVVMDSQGINYNAYREIIEVVGKEEEIIARVKELRREFEERVKTGKKKPMIVFIDEVFEILKMDMQVKSDINYLLEVGSTMNIYPVVSTDSVMEDDINDLFGKDNTPRLSFYLTTRGEYYDFMGKVIDDRLGNDGMYLDGDENLSKICIPLIGDDEVERVVSYVKEERKKKK